MRLVIHKGASEVGGNCIQLISEGKSIFLDAGVPLEELEDKDKKPDLIDFSKIKASNKSTILGILLSHAHQDHFLSLKNAGDIPIFTGEPSYGMLKVLKDFSMDGDVPLENVATFKDGEKFNIGPFTITPILVDHSIYDAHAFYITDGDSSVLYTGDIRFHGRKKHMMEKVFDRFASPDILLVEGTNILEKGDNAIYKDENSLEEPMTKFMNKTKGLSLVVCSSMNIDRVVTVFKAALKAKRELIIDLYTAEILRAVGNDKIPNTSWPNVHLYLNGYHRGIVKRNGFFDMVKGHGSGRLFEEEINKNRSKYVLLYKKSNYKFLEKNNLLDDSSMIYSIWEGYLEKEKSLNDLLDFYKIPFKFIHISGHMYKNNLVSLVEKLKPKTIIPIHTNNKEMFREFENAVLLDNGEEYELQGGNNKMS